MSNTPFTALVIRQENDSYIRSLETRHIDDLPDGEVLVRVLYSSLNYKDALSAIGNRGVTRKYPHTPGIDAAGVVESSTVDYIQAGEEVIVSCYDLGMSTAGGFAEFIRVPAAWVVKKPTGLSLKESMAYGTAGFTAALSVHKLLKQGVRPEDGPVLVTGATGGVGSVAVSILAGEGFHVTAASGKDAEDFLISLGAKEIVSRNQVSGGTDKALLRPRWAGVIDTVGGEILTKAIKSILPCGAATTCGNVAGAELNITVYPFILRGVSLIGIDAAECPLALRKEIWQKIATDWKLDHLESLTNEITLSDVSGVIDQILAGKMKGRTVVKIS